MNYDVEYDLLNELGIEVINEKNELERLLKDLLDIVIEICNNWSGGDSQLFQNTVITYVQKEVLKTTGDIAYIGNFFRLAAGTYYDSDNTWGKDVKKIGDDYYAREEQHTT